MNRRRFVGSVAAAGTGMLLHRSAVWSAQPYRARLLLRGATLYDGTGSAPITGDVALDGDRIIGLGRNLSVSGTEIIDLRGLALAPGFIDIHSHTDLSLFVNPRAESKIRQGVTTEIAGQDGSSVGPVSTEAAARTSENYKQRYGVELGFTDLQGFFLRLERHRSSVNLGSMVGAGTIRGLVIGNDNRPPTDTELTRMVALVEQALRQGALGLSSGLEYSPGGFATRDELVALARALRATALPYASHMRNEDDELFAAVEEAIAVGRFAGVPVQISHLKAQGQRNWWKSNPVLKTIEDARAGGIDVLFDRYPYVAYATGLSNLFPLWTLDGGTRGFLQRIQDPAQRPRIEAYVRDKIDELGSWDAVQITSTGDALTWARGKRMGQLARERNTEPYELLLEITIADENRTGMVGFGMSEESTADMLKHPLGMICSDAGARATYGPLSEGSPHPRTYGSFPRVLGHYCRDQKLMPLETAVHKMSFMPARRLKLEGRGVIQPNAFADLVAFDPVRVADRATFERPHQYPVGIPHVWVNGEAVIRNGEHTGSLPGRVLRGAAATLG
ncbi:MAG: N-acyl-D-amino-acid deacylase family protein [Longimicrobiales bacterium]